MNRRIPLGQILWALCLLGSPSVAEACSCGGVASSAAAFKNSAAVFVGTVDQVTGGMPQPIVAVFRVTRSYRGTADAHVVVTGDGTSCDRAFLPGVQYLVYAADDAGRLSAHKCTRTRPLAKAAEDVRYLESLLAGRPQALVHGLVFRRVPRPASNFALQALFEPLEVVARSANEGRSVTTDERGPYQLALVPGSYELWIERQGRRVSPIHRLTLAAGDERELSFTTSYR